MNKNEKRNTKKRNTKKRNTKKRIKKRITKKVNYKKHMDKRIRKINRKNMKGGMNPMIQIIIDQYPEFNDFIDIIAKIDYNEFMATQDKSDYLEGLGWPAKKGGYLLRFKQKMMLLNTLNTGKVYNLDDLNVNFNYFLNLNLNLNGLNLNSNLPNPIYSNPNCSVHNLEIAGTNGKKLPLVLKVINSIDKSEEFFAKIFKHIPEFNQEWLTDNKSGEFVNCGIMQSKFLHYDGQKQYMLLESGVSDSVMDLNQWIIKNKDIDNKTYVILATKILWQIISQIICLQKYGIIFFDIKSKNILVLQNGVFDVRIMLIDTGGFIYHIPTFNSKMSELPNSEEIKETIRKMNFSGDIFEYERFLDLNDFKRLDFPSSLGPLFLGGAFARANNFKDGKDFNIFAVSLLANEIICRGRSNTLERRSSGNFIGLGLRGYPEHDDIINDSELISEYTNLESYLNEFNESHPDKISYVFNTLINLSIKISRDPISPLPTDIDLETLSSEILDKDFELVMKER